MKRLLSIIGVVALATVGLLATPASANALATGFEPPAWHTGDPNQNDWTVDLKYDAEVVTPGIFGTQAMRISNGFADGGFTGQLTSDTVAQAGEAAALSHFEAEFTIQPTKATLQTDLKISISPQSGGGARMSYLRFEDQASGIHVYFDDVTGTSDPANFNETDIVTLNRTSPHSVRFVMDFVAGPSNDVVKIYIDGMLEITGTSWENYYRYDDESNAGIPPANWTTRPVDSLMFRAGGAAALSNAGEGFLIDDVTLQSGSVSVAAPDITGISPASGPVGTALTITGTHLSGASVTVGGKAAVITSISDTKIVTSVPSGLAAGAASVVVTTAGGTDSIGFTVTTTPTPTPTTYSRWLTFDCHHGGSLVADGYVHGAVAAAYDRVPVKIQRRTVYGWRTIGYDRTNHNGWYREVIPDRDGRYRAVALQHTHADGTIYLRAVSPVHVHR